MNTNQQHSMIENAKYMKCFFANVTQQNIQYGGTFVKHNYIFSA